MNEKVNPEIMEYVETKILPQYNGIGGHTDEHIRQVIARSLKFYEQTTGLNIDMVYLIAAYHDLGRLIDNETHNFESAKLLRKDEFIKARFSPEDIETMAQAVEDHRSSLGHEPRSIYGKIVSSADRNPDLETSIKRSYDYHKHLHSDASEDEIIEQCRDHLRRKYSTNGYAANTMYFDDPNFQGFLEEVEQKTQDPNIFKKEVKMVLAKREKSTEGWDKVFPKSDEVEHKKVTFKNHFGIELVADMYIPKNASGRLPAIAVSGPYGAVKEQSSGLYAQEMAKRGFIAIAFDPSYTGESGGEPRYVTSWDLNVEDFQASVDYLSNLPEVDADKISIIGVCGWGGVALQTACLDTRIKATICMTMYDMPRVARNGYFDEQDSAEARNEAKRMVNSQRSEDYRNGELKLGGGVVDPLPDDAPQFVKDYHAYYKTPRGYHARSLNSNGGWAMTGNISLINTTAFTNSDEIQNAVLIVHGEKAHSRYMGEDAFANMTGYEYASNNKPAPYTGNAPLGLTKVGNKELLIIEGASHCDLYDQVDIIPFDEIENFIRKNI